jgi:hypothetical protein
MHLILKLQKKTCTILNFRISIDIAMFEVVESPKTERARNKLEEWGAKD